MPHLGGSLPIPTFPSNLQDLLALEHNAPTVEFDQIYNPLWVWCDEIVDLAIQVCGLLNGRTMGKNANKSNDKS